MRKYTVLITFLFLLFLKAGLYGESNGQPKWNITLFGDIIADVGVDLGIGGAVGLNLTPWVGLEGEVNLHFLNYISIVSAGVVLGNSDVKQGQLSPYLVGGIAYGRIEAGAVGGMLGGGLKIRHKEELIRLDLRLYFFPDRIWKKFFIGWIWTF